MQHWFIVSSSNIVNSNAARQPRLSSKNCRLTLSIHDDLCVRGRYPGQGQIITSQKFCGVLSLVFALDTCFWHTKGMNKSLHPTYTLGSNYVSLRNWQSQPFLNINLCGMFDRTPNNTPSARMYNISQSIYGSYRFAFSWLDSSRFYIYPEKYA